MEISVEKLQRKDLKEAILVYDQNHHLKTNIDKLFSIYDKAVGYVKFIEKK